MSSGSFQILHNDEWGRVCSDNFGRIEAQVACQLGYRNGSVLQTPEATSTQKIWLNILKCNGGESKLIDCSHIDWEQDICSHGNVVGIRCYERQGDVRINSSRLEILYNETWGTVCGDDFDDKDATVACRQLGFNSGTSLGGKVDYGTGRIWLDDLQCSGNELTLADCSHSDWGVTNCQHSEDVGIKCWNAYDG
ncbi:Scavenger receptor cysteine-rich type 1 protein M130 [Mytilus edulis]|uniref:Scavenger receptor cysteine-rich type 1 protein M130 n=1 Tax=Mytilus edulis TaxID=6550 RepID=A0A8S3PQV7_MYTED|nr:Scavenger receptor cysteine-rich type 1 protein M130 [Mytilus edulis]